MTYSATAAWLRPRLWMAFVVGVIPWCFWIGSLAVGGWYKDYEGTLIGADHLAFYTAAHLIHDGQQEQLYDYLALSSRGYEQSLIGWNWGGFEAFRNPPFYALLYLTTVELSYYASCLIWMAVGLGLLVLAAWLLNPEQPFRTVIWCLTFYPVFATVSFGQNTFLSLAIFAGIYRLLEANRRFAAGVLAGLLWFKPQLLLGLFVWWIYSPGRYFRCWLGVGLMGLLLAAVSWVTVPGASLAFVDHFQTIVAFRGFGLWNVHTPKAFFELLLPDHPEISGLLGLAMSLISIVLAWRIASRTQASVGAMFPVAVFLSLWASPHALIYEWSLLIAACVVLWKNDPQQRDAWLCLFTLIWLSLAISTTICYVQFAHLHFFRKLQLSIPILALVGGLGQRQLLSARSMDERA
jgi:hypothetical protein